MNIKLPKCFLDESFFSDASQINFIIFGCFFFSLMLIVYSVVVLSKKEPHFGVKKFKLRRKITKSDLENPDSDISEEVYQDALRVLDKARSDSMKILGRAQVKAQSLLDSTYAISQENRRNLEENVQSIYEKQEKALDNLSEELLDSYKNAVEKGKQENIRTLYEVTTAMKNEALSGVDEFKDVIKKGTLEAQEALEGKISEEYTKVDEEVKDYRDKKIKSVNNKIFDLLSDIYSDVIGQDLDQVKYEKLILKMLEEEIQKSGLKKDS